ncbi:hypothetical protein [Saccharothrix syringae]|nr:hypothetical protein [Saccharothrix syringae]
MVVHSLRKGLAALAVLAGLAVFIGAPASAAAQDGTVTARVFQAPYSQP